MYCKSLHPTTDARYLAIWDESGSGDQALRLVGAMPHLRDTNLCEMKKLRREQSHWERLAADDPMWVILTEPGKRGAWDEVDFFESGRREISDALALLKDRFEITPRPGVALDFGSGLGRLSQGLAEHFDQVHGVDISATMVGNATEKNRHGDRVTYHVNTSDRLPMLTNDSVDFIYSRITLQHIPRPAVQSYLAEFARVMRPGGVAMFQLMTRARPWTVRVRHRLRDLAPGLYRSLRDAVSRRARWEMNTFSERAVLRVMEASGTRVAAVVEEPEMDAVFESSWFVVIKPNA